MKLIISTGSHTGKVRSRNEDMVLVSQSLVREEIRSFEVDTDSIPFWVAVSDGMGGHKGGAFASQYILTRMSACASQLPKGLNEQSLKDRLAEQIVSIHEDLNKIGAQEADKKSLGATFVGVLFYENQVFSIHIGDSRLYRYRDTILAQLTKDHTLQASTNDPSISRSILTNSFGGGVDEIHFDFDNLSDRYLMGDVLLLCSDGLFEHLDDRLIGSSTLLENSVEQMIKQANEAGGTDNISVAVIQRI